MTFPTPPSQNSGGSASADRSAVFERVRLIMRRDLKLGNDIIIDETTPFVGGVAEIDSLDILLMLASVEKEFQIKIGNAEMGQRVFQNVGTLTSFLVGQLNGKKAASPPAPAAPSTAELLARLPHQAPFRFVSRLTAIEPGRSAEGIWAVSGKEDFFAGHFPGRPIVPGVLIAEALAQMSGLAANVANSDGRLAKVDVRFDSAVVPPAEIVLRAKMSRTIGAVIQYDVEASCGKTIVASGTITLGWSPAGGAKS